jgi:hypothetical protein
VSVEDNFFFEFHPYSARKKIEKKCFRDDTFGGFAGEFNEIFGFESIVREALWGWRIK